MIKKIKHLSELQAEKQRLKDRISFLEKKAGDEWQDLKYLFNPMNRIKDFFGKLFKRSRETGSRDDESRSSFFGTMVSALTAAFNRQAASSESK